MAERLTDLEVLVKGMKNRLKRYEKEYGCLSDFVSGYEEAIDDVVDAPAVEAKPVVHAHWEEVITVIKKIHEYEQEDIQYRCDHCGHIVDDFENYCGGCGAQMFESVKIPVISMEDVPNLAKEMEK